MRSKLPNIEVPDMPDVGGLADDLLGLADTAADAISSAAGHVPGLDDYRAVARRRRILATVGVIALVLVVVAAVRSRRDDDKPAT